MSDQTPFLVDDHDESAHQSCKGRGDARPAREAYGRRFARTMLVVQAVLMGINILLLWRFAHLYRNCRVSKQTVPKDQMFSAEPALRYHYQRVDTHDENDPFSGRPSPEVDEAWSKLLHASAIRITKAELQSLNRSSIPLSDGSGYLAYLETYHMLHCVKRIYQFQYREFYSDVITTGELTLPHWEHCLQVLRKGIMCNAGSSVNTYIWDPIDPTKLRGDSTGPRKCVNWSIFEAWADKRVVSKSQYPERNDITP